MKLIIAGGRDYIFTREDTKKLDEIPHRIDEVVSGGASGADVGGETYALLRRKEVIRFLPDWEAHGKAAGPIRNRQMAEYADAVALFPGGKGTESMRKEAVKAGITIFDFTKP